MKLKITDKQIEDILENKIETYTKNKKWKKTEDIYLISFQNLYSKLTNEQKRELEILYGHFNDMLRYENIITFRLGMDHTIEKMGYIKER